MTAMTAMTATATRSTAEFARVSVCGQELRAHIRQGDGTGHPLLLCNGIGAGLEFLQPLVDALDPGIELIRFDVPGAGGSPVALLPYAFPTLAWLATRMLDELGYRGQVDVLGYSWGGALAQQMAIQHPRRCRRLILISTSSGLLSVPGRPSTMKGMLRPQSVRGARRGRPAVATAAPGARPPGPGDDPGRAGAPADRTGLGYLHQLAAIATWTSLPFLSMIRQPTLVIGGDDDWVAPAANARILASLIPNSTLRIVPGDHSSIVTRAPEYGRMISQFVR